MKVAFVYDRVNKIGGAERALQALHEIWPKAPLFTTVYDKKSAPWAKDFKVISSFLQKLPFAKKHHEFYPYLASLAFESFNFDDFEVVISVTSAEAKGIITKPKTCHICYCLTPTRYLWIKEKTYLENPGFGVLNPLARLMFKSTSSWLKKWDKLASTRPDYYLAISQRVKKRIKKYYGQDSEVIYPPVDLSKFKGLKGLESLRGDYFLLVSRLVSYKRVDLAIKTFNKLGIPLKIVGTGSLEKSLKKISRKNISFLGQLTDQQLLVYYHNCEALIMPQEEDFGLVALEAQALGKPVITFKESGAAEVVQEGKTGEFFLRQKVESLVKVIKNFKAAKYKAEDCRKNIQKYRQELFKKKIKKFVESHATISRVSHSAI